MLDLPLMLWVNLPVVDATGVENIRQQVTQNVVTPRNHHLYYQIFRRIYQPRGKVWGGSSSLNAMVYVRGHAYDYDRWEKEGAEGWSYADCLPYFRKSQTHELGKLLLGCLFPLLC